MAHLTARLLQVVPNQVIRTILATEFNSDLVVAAATNPCLSLDVIKEYPNSFKSIEPAIQLAEHTNDPEIIEWLVTDPHTPWVALTHVLKNWYVSETIFYKLTTSPTRLPLWFRAFEFYPPELVEKVIAAVPPEQQLLWYGLHKPTVAQNVVLELSSQVGVLDVTTRAALANLMAAHPTLPAQLVTQGNVFVGEVIAAVTTDVTLLVDIVENTKRFDNRAVRNTLATIWERPDIPARVKGLEQSQLQSRYEDYAPKMWDGPCETHKAGSCTLIDAGIVLGATLAGWLETTQNASNAWDVASCVASYRNYLEQYYGLLWEGGMFRKEGQPVPYVDIPTRRVEPAKNSHLVAGAVTQLLDFRMLHPKDTVDLLLVWEEVGSWLVENLGDSSTPKSSRHWQLLVTLLPNWDRSFNSLLDAVTRL